MNNTLAKRRKEGRKQRCWRVGTTRDRGKDDQLRSQHQHCTEDAISSDNRNCKEVGEGRHEWPGYLNGLMNKGCE